MAHNRGDIDESHYLKMCLFIGDMVDLFGLEMFAPWFWLCLLVGEMAFHHLEIFGCSLIGFLMRMVLMVHKN